MNQNLDEYFKGFKAFLFLLMLFYMQICELYACTGFRILYNLRISVTISRITIVLPLQDFM